MKIALFSDTYPPQINGVATATYTLCEVLKKHGQDVLVVTVAKEGQHHVTYEDGIVRLPGFTVKKLYNYKFSNIFSKKVYDILKRYRPDVIHVQTEVGIGIFGRIVAKQMDIPLVYTYHTMYEDYTYYVTKGYSWFDRFAKRVVASFSAMVSDNTTEFTTTSEKTKEALRRYGVKKYINVVPNGVDFSFFDKSNVDEKKVEQLKEKYHIKDCFVLLILGRLAKEKSNDVILSCFHDFLLQHPEKTNLRLMIVGDGPNKPDLEEQVKSLGLDKEVIFTGAVPHKDVPAYYRLANLFVSASVTETQGLTYTEAMASDVLVLARFDKNLEGTIHDGKSGFFFTKLADFKEKLSYILELSEEEKAKLRAQAYQDNVARFSLELYYQRMINVYWKAIKKYW